MSSSICSLSSKGEGKPPPQVSEGERGSRRAGQEQSLLLAQAPLAGAGARCRGAGWHRALPTSPELIASPEVVGAAPWGARGACRAVPCCAAQLCPPLPAAVPGLWSAQAQRGDGSTPEFGCWGAGQDKVAGLPSRSWFMSAKFQNTVAIIIIDNRKTKIYGDPTGDEALTRHVAVQGILLSRCL